MKPIDLLALPGLIDIVEEQMATIPSIDWKTYSTSKVIQDEAIAAATAVLEAIGAKLEKKSYAHAIKLGGFRASCTSSFDGALGNWCTAARKRLAA